MDDMEQLDLFPRATIREIRLAKRMLERYVRDKAEAAELEVRGGGVEYDKRIERIRAIESAVRLILDREVRDVVQYRYIEGHRNKDTVIRFAGEERTVNRMIKRGIVSVAESIKLFRCP